MDRDGDLDVVTAQGSSGSVRWHQNDGNQQFTTHDVDANRSAFEVFAADLDADGDVDVAIASTAENLIAWYENDGGQQFTRRDVAFLIDAESIVAADMDGDGDLDLLSGGGGRFDGNVHWHENADMEISVRGPAAPVAEDDVQALTFTFTRSGNRRAEDVEFELNGTATLDVDYSLTGASVANGSIVTIAFPDDVTTVEVIATPIDDSHRELDETIILTLPGGDGYATGDPATATGVITSGEFGGDLGDAPSFYPVLLAENGAVHQPIGPQLGASRDAEDDGAHSVGADADGADEDGVTWGPIQVGRLDAELTVDIQNAPAGARVSAWIDFDRDGTWTAAAERIVSNAAVSEGTHVFSFDVPAVAASGTTYLRVRVSSFDVDSPSGYIADGEVEDFQVSIDPPASSLGIFGAARRIADSLGAVEYVAAVDLDQDGVMDLVTSHDGLPDVVWHRNDGTQSYQQITLVENLSDPRELRFVDFDSDGDLDLFAASNSPAWFENDGNQVFTRRNIPVFGSRQAAGIAIADVDHDGDHDLLVAWEDLGGIEWLENDGAQSFTQHDLPVTVREGRQIVAADFNGDGQVDVGVSYLSNSFKYVVAWLERDAAGQWTEHLVGETSSFVTGLKAADLDADGDIDLLTGEVGWRQNDGSGGFSQPDLVSTLPFSTSGATQLANIGDLDGDGDLDVVDAAGRWHVNDGTGEFSLRQFSREWFRAVATADVDGDGDLDILTLHAQEQRLAWHENLADADFGDAPHPYPTEPAEDGAGHEPTGPVLGTLRDAEPQGEHSPDAQRDADDDGVVFDSLRAGQLGAEVTVYVANAPQGARLDAWIDFNGDGNWGGHEDQIADSLNVSEGDNFLSFDVPSDARQGLTYARFRLSTTGNLSHDLVAADGEVEDYQVMIFPPRENGGLFSAGADIAATARGIESIEGADIDGDGDVDLLAAFRSDSHVEWFENLGAGDFVQHLIDATATLVEQAIAADINGDGHLDVVAALNLGDEIRWYKNDGSQNFTLHVATPHANDPTSVAAVDMEGDGDLDIVYAEDNNVRWLENRGFDANWSRRTIRNLPNPHYAESVDAADFDRDGDVDVVSAWPTEDTIQLHVNNGEQQFESIEIDSGANFVDVHVADVDGDGDMDIVAAAEAAHGVRWYENHGDAICRPLHQR